MNNTYNLKNWFKLGLISLIIVALYGTTMRYKIAFNFPYLEQKNIMHAHSHFGFIGWLSHIIYCGLALNIFPFITKIKQKKYIILIAANLACALGMLISFTLYGYRISSIAFTSLTILINIIFTIAYIFDSKFFPKNNPSKYWAITGLLLNIVSAAGPLSLAYIMTNKVINFNFYLGSVYYYLHFQYNGWFFFGGMAMVSSILPLEFPSIKKYYYAFAITAIPTFFLSILWAKLPLWLYIITVIATIIQFFAWVMLVYKGYQFLKNKEITTRPKWVNILFYAAAFALTIKFTLQTISVIPSLSQMVYGFRPIIIAYIHLVLLGVFSLFILGYLFQKQIFSPSASLKFATLLFLIGVILNELVLAIQGFAALTYTPVPFINEMLFAVAVILLSSSIMLFAFQKKNNKI
ncbi:MAG TPA: hypothetical protein PLY81_06315 [Chitinophagaceae bacterium]|nr:hypothetical protein [Chitinophagaceae bacterium]HNF29876.1 hypothetical protein [Chitinophagaceae bacterium]HNJ58911.1 hypothetical protein [Chitinophagaceae bacterium]HNM35215.1 hypothetical protein [Chitinophagaceae bacterium]HNN30537.1 hypothetical protein [Chitinophagaceae bacterium]